MGVKDLTSLIKRFAPNATKPFTIEAFKGKTLAIDGNLLMQKFHHGSPDKSNQLMWYRFLKHLVDVQITPICVFDGPNRHPAKRAELAKRRLVRETHYNRGVLEATRTEALSTQVSLANAYLDSLDMQKASEYFSTAPPLDPQAPVSTEELFRNAAPASLEDLKAEVEALSIASQMEETADIAGTDDSIPSSSIPDDASLSSGPLPSLTQADINIPPPTIDPTSLLQPESPTAAASSRSTQLSKTDQALQTLTEGIERLEVQRIPVEEAVSPSPSQKELDLLEKDSRRRILEANGDADLLREIVAVMTSLQGTSNELAEKYVHRSAPIPKQDYEMVQRLIRAMGISWLETPETLPVEAEATASALVQAGIADAVISEDTDVLLYDVPMIRNITGFKKETSVLDGKAVREEMGLSREAFVDLCILCGTDFCETVPKIGHVTAYKLITQHSSIEEILSVYAHKYDFPEDYLDQVKLARQVFFQKSAEVLGDAESFKLKEPAEDLKLVMTDLGIESELTNNVPLDAFGQSIGPL